MLWRFTYAEQEEASNVTNKERVIQALNHEQPDICPYNIPFTIPMAQKMADHYGDEHFQEKLGNHIAMIEPVRDDAWVEVRPGYWRDQFGVVWNRTVDKDIGNPDEFPLADGNLDAFAFPDPDDPERYAAVDPFCKKHADDFLVGAIGFSLFERAWTLRGMEQLLMDMIMDPPVSYTHLRAHET